MWENEDPRPAYAVRRPEPLDHSPAPHPPSPAQCDLAARLLRAIREDHPARARARVAEQLRTGQTGRLLAEASSALHSAERLAVALAPVIAFLERYEA